MHRHFSRFPLQWCVSRVGYCWFRYICGGKIEGSTEIDECLEDGFVLVSNHVSYLDWIVLWAYLEIHHNTTPVFVAKERLFKHWVWGWLVTSTCCIKVSDNGDSISLDEYRKLRKAKHIVIFPEGTRSQSGDLGAFRDGAVKISSRLQRIILPAQLWGFHSVWPPRSIFPRIRKCGIRIGKTIRPNKNLSSEDLRSAVNSLAPKR